MTTLINMNDDDAESQMMVKAKSEWKGIKNREEIRIESNQEEEKK